MTGSDPYAGVVRVRTCGILIHENRILLANQVVPTGAETVWLPPGGGVDMGETAEDALKREFREETHLEIAQLKLRYLHEFIKPPYHAIELYFVVTGFSGTLKLGSDPEHRNDQQLLEEVSYVPVEDLEDIKLKPDFLTGEIKTGKIYESRITHFKSRY